jgi:conjugative element/phage-associated large polyvalent protein
VRGLGSILTRGEMYQRWLKSGGANSALVAIDRDYINQNVIKLEQPGALNRVKNVVKSPLEALRILSELSENATRVGEFMRATGKGKDAFAAGFGSREVTLDFARRGAQMRGLNLIIPFLNAQIEGNDRAARAFKDHPLRTTFRVMLSITLPSILLWWVNHDDDRWKELPRWQRDLFWIILTDKWEPYRVKGDDGKLRDATDDDVGNRASRTYFRKAGDRWEVNNGTVWRIPKPFELGILFGSVPERILDAFFTDHPNALKNLHKSVIGALLPNFIPQAALPIMEHLFGRSFFLERPLVPKYLEDIRPKFQIGPQTTETAQLVGKLIAKANDKTSFGSPMVIENYVRAWTGTLGMSALQAIDKGLDIAGLAATKVKPEKTLADTPVIRAFVARYPGAGVQSVEDFYDEYHDRKVNIATVKYLAKSGEAEESRAEADGHPLVTAEKIHQALGVQSKVIRGIYQDKTMTPREKRELIDATYFQMIELAKAGNDIFRKSDKRKELENLEY